MRSGLDCGSRDHRGRGVGPEWLRRLSAVGHRKFEAGTLRCTSIVSSRNGSKARERTRPRLTPLLRPPPPPRPVHALLAMPYKLSASLAGHAADVRPYLPPPRPRVLTRPRLGLLLLPLTISSSPPRAIQPRSPGPGRPAHPLRKPLPSAQAPASSTPSRTSLQHQGPQKVRTRPRQPAVARSLSRHPSLLSSSPPLQATRSREARTP